MKSRTLRELKHIAREALKSEYGFAPALKDIKLMESNDIGTYIAFMIEGRYYRFDSYITSDDCIWVGKGHIEKMPQYDII